MKNLLSTGALALALAVLTPSVCSADDLVLVPDVSLLTWDEVNGKVYLRNLDTFDSTFLGCCWNFYIDLSTDEGKAQFGAMLTRATTHGRLWFGFSSKSTPGPVKYLGDW